MTHSVTNAITITTKKEEEEKVLMPEEDKALLKELYLLRSYSGFEEPMRRGIVYFLQKLKIPFFNLNGNIIGFNHPGAPLFSAHMDMVNTEGYKLQAEEYALDGNHVFTLDKKACIRLYRDKEKKYQTSLGADDKNGIWVILTLLKKGKKINFAFCHSEETGGTGSTQIVSDPDCEKFIKGCKYGIIIDRRNANDIIGYGNKYCLALDDRLEQFAKEHKFKFKCASGLVSDADRFSRLIECVNLSCGYYEPHTSKEYTNLNELWNTYLFCERMLDKFEYTSVSEDRMKSFKGTTSTTYSYKSKYGYQKDNEEKSSYLSYYNKKEEKEPEKKSSYYGYGNDDEDERDSWKRLYGYYDY